MSDVNKLDNKQCPFDPEQYKIDTLAAPVATSPWALIQVYLGNKVHRKDWSAPDEYIYLIPGSGNDEPEIKKRDKYGVMTSWQPTQEDLMACDWSLLKIKPKPVECILSFDLKVGAHRDSFAGKWGYLSKGGFIDSSDSTFGTLTDLQSTVGTRNILGFYFKENTGNAYSRMLLLQVDNQNQSDLPSKNLEITIGCSTFKLGSSNPLSPTFFRYASDEATKLGDLLKQNVDKTLSFCFNWK